MNEEPSEIKKLVKRRLRKIAKDSDDDAVLDQDQDLTNQHSNSQEADNDSFAKQLQDEANGGGDDAKTRLKTRKAKPKYNFEYENNDDQDFDLNVENDEEYADPVSGNSNERKQKKKKEGQVNKPKPKTQKSTTMALKNINVVKTNNKLIGEIENNELYADDDLMQEHREPLEDLENLELDLELVKSKSVEADNPKKANFLNKIKSKREAEAANDDIAAGVLQLGMLDKKNVTANELAAQGVHLSLRDQFAKQIQQMELENVKNQSKESSKIEQQPEVSQKVAVEDDNQIDTSGAVKLDQSNKSEKENSVKEVQDEEDEDEGLEFYDPKAEEREKQVKRQEELQRNQCSTLNGAPTAQSSFSRNLATQFQGKAAGTNNRNALLKQLESAHLQAKSRHLTLDKIKDTFQATALNEKSKAKSTAVGIDGKEVELQEGDDDEDDEEYVDPDALGVPENEDWDDEENSVKQASEEGEEEGKSEAEEEEQPEENQSKQEEVVEEDDLVNALMEQASNFVEEEVKSKVSEVQKIKLSQNSATSSVRFRQRRLNLPKELAGLIEDEAEVGSDDEEHGDRVKKIRRDDVEEREEGLDSDLEGFIDRDMPADADEIADPDDGAYQRYMMDVVNDERDKTRAAMRAAIFGHDKKRKGWEEDADMDDLQRRKMERVREREQEQQLMGLGEEELERHLLEGGSKRIRDAIALKKLAEEEELSEDELRQQVDNTRFYKFLQKRNKTNLQKTLAEKEQKMQDEMKELLNTDEDKSPEKNTVQVDRRLQVKKFTSGQLLGQKKTMHPSDDSTKATKSTVVTSKIDTSVSQAKKASYGGAGTSMLRFLKTSGGDPFKNNNAKPLGRNAGAAPAPFFRQGKNKA